MKPNISYALNIWDVRSQSALPKLGSRRLRPERMALDDMNTDEDLLEIRRELLKTLFVISEAGVLDEYIKHAARMHVRLAVRRGEIQGNEPIGSRLESCCQAQGSD